jgi:hypothetical protein
VNIGLHADVRNPILPISHSIARRAWHGAIGEEDAFPMHSQIFCASKLRQTFKKKHACQQNEDGQLHYDLNNTQALKQGTHILSNT